MVFLYALQPVIIYSGRNFQNFPLNRITHLRVHGLSRTFWIRYFRTPPRPPITLTLSSRANFPIIRDTFIPNTSGKHITKPCFELWIRLRLCIRNVTRSINPFHTVDLTRFERIVHLPNCLAKPKFSQFF